MHTGFGLRLVPDRIAQLPEPFEGGVFDDGFVEGHRLLPRGCDRIDRINEFPKLCSRVDIDLRQLLLAEV